MPVLPERTPFVVVVRIGKIAGGLSLGKAGELLDTGDDPRQDDQN